MKPQILVADDEQFIREELCEALEEAGYETQSAARLTRSSV